MKTLVCISDRILRRKWLIFIFLGLGLIGCVDDIVLVKDGHSDFVIKISDKASPAEQYSARELQKYIFKISVCKLPIKKNNEPSDRSIYIGLNSAPESLLRGLDISEFGKEEFVIRSVGKNLLIGGGKPRGTLYGVLTFLSDYLGCRWYTKEVTKIPQKADITLEHIDKRQKPAFEYREGWYREAYDTEWAIHNRLNPSIVPIPDSLGGSYITYPFVHTFYRLVPPDKYFHKHPEYFSLIDGKRKGHEAQLCLTNPEVVEIATQTVFRWIKENPQANVFSVDQNDGYGWCECTACSTLDEEEGSHSATVLNFVNQIADSVVKVHPEVKLQTLAYAYTEIPPKTIKPRPNVTIRMCHYEYCCAHAIGDCDNHLPFIERLEAWGKIADRITIWDYFTDFRHYLIPFPNFESVKKHPRFYADHNCIGLFAQGNNVPKYGGGEFSALRAWVFAQLMWDPYQDSQALIDEFVINVYGDAAPEIDRYIKLLHAKAKPDSVYFSIFFAPPSLTYLTPEFVLEAEKIFLDAEKKSLQNKALLKRVELAHLPILYTQLYFYSIGGRGYLDENQLPAMLNKFQRICEEHNIVQFAESSEMGNVEKFIKRIKFGNTFFSDWWLIGPFDNPNREGLKKVYPPETEYNNTQSYKGSNNQTVKWRQYENKYSGYIDFTKILMPSDEGVAYARRIIEVSENTKLNLGIGSNDGVKLWVNGNLVLDNPIARKAEPNQDVLTVPFKKGQNVILLKIDQIGGGWGFYFAVMDNENLLR